MAEARLVLAHRVLAALASEQAVRRAALRGSLATGLTDELSDIDVVIDVWGSDNGRCAAGIPSVLGRHGPVLFSDWAPGLLPRTSVQTCFLDGALIFWHVDVECAATPHVPSVAHVAVQPRDHCLKLWGLDAKYLPRGAASAESNVRRLAARLLPAADAMTAAPRLLMRRVLDELARSAPSTSAEFLRRCEEIPLRIEALPGTTQR